MGSIAENILQVLASIPSEVTLVAVSKTRPVSAIIEAYHAGQRDFGENRVQEMLSKAPSLPGDILWHQIGHLQTNKVKYIAPFVHMIHSVDSYKLLSEISKQAVKCQRVIDVLLQVYIADEETKFGFEEHEILEMLEDPSLQSLAGVRIRGLMGIATFSEDLQKITNEFKYLKSLYNRILQTFFSDCTYFDRLSMGMTHDYVIAIQEGSNMIRIGTLIFGER